MKLDYKILKKKILKAVRQPGQTLEFVVNAKQLDTLVRPLGISFIYNDFQSEQVTGSNIPLLSEYFKREKLSWFNRSRHFSTLTFVDLESLDDRGNRILEELQRKDRSEDPSFDRADYVAELLAYYPCYNATVVSYRSEDPERMGKNSYTIIIRANINAILKQQYEYYHGENNPDNPDQDDNIDNNDDGE